MSESTLYSFTGANGALPYNSVINQNGILYGTTYDGGGSNTGTGTLFSYKISDNSYNILHSFTGPVTDGSHPNAAVLFESGILYGTTYDGGASNTGTLFSYRISDGSYNILHSFTGFGTDGLYPTAEVIHQSGILYGTTDAGGYYGIFGTLFSYRISDGSFNTLHSFSGIGAEGKNPYAAVIYQDGILYGTTANGGGSSNTGTLFSYNLTSSILTTLHSFSGANGVNPFASVIYQDGILYGTTKNGGDSNTGTLFSYKISDSSYNILHSFTGTGTDGVDPYASVIYQDGILYGTTANGGSSNKGTLFSYDITFTSFNTLYSFTGIGTDGAQPYASVIYQDGVLYGTTVNGGGISDTGTLFSYTLPIPPIPPAICIPKCPAPVFSKPGVSFGGTENIVAFENTQAYKYSVLVNVPNNGRSTMIYTPLNKYGYKNPPPPPRNRFG